MLVDMISHMFWWENPNMPGKWWFFVLAEFPHQLATPQGTNKLEIFQLAIFHYQVIFIDLTS